VASAAWSHGPARARQAMSGRAVIRRLAGWCPMPQFASQCEHAGGGSEQGKRGGLGNGGDAVVERDQAEGAGLGIEGGLEFPALLETAHGKDGVAVERSADVEERECLS